MERNKQKLPDEVVEAWRDCGTSRFVEAARLIDVAENIPTNYILLTCNGLPLGLYSTYELAESAASKYEERLRLAINTIKRFYQYTEVGIDQEPRPFFTLPEWKELGKVLDSVKVS